MASGARTRLLSLEMVRPTPEAPLVARCNTSGCEVLEPISSVHHGSESEGQGTHPKEKGMRNCFLTGWRTLEVFICFSWGGTVYFITSLLYADPDASALCPASNVRTLHHPRMHIGSSWFLHEWCTPKIRNFHKTDLFGIFGYHIYGSTDPPGPIFRQACSHYQLYNGKAAEAELKAALEGGRVLAMGLSMLPVA